MQQHTQSSTESWLPVVGYEGQYEVSNRGAVRSLDRWVPYSDGRKPRFARGQVLKPMQGSTDPRTGLHLRVDLSKTTTRYVHQLVLEAFVGPCPAGYLCRHLDGDATNNALSNLRWDTARANNLDTVRHGRNPSSARTHCPRGHVLADPNLTASGKRCGRRACRACTNARSYVFKHRHIDFEAEADRRYAALIGGVITLTGASFTQT